MLLDAIAERVMQYQTKPKIAYKMIQEYYGKAAQTGFYPFEFEGKKADRSKCLNYATKENLILSELTSAEMDVRCQQKGSSCMQCMSWFSSRRLLRPEAR